MVAAGNDLDYTETLKKTFGKKGWIAGMVLFIFMLSIPIILYFQLLSQFLFPIILFFIELATGEERKLDTDLDFSQFSYSYTCLIVFAILFTVTAKRDLGIFVKINAFGVIFTMIIITFIIGVGIYGVSTQSYKFVGTPSDMPAVDPIGNDSSLVYLALVANGYNSLLGILGGGFYLHNISLPIYRNSRNPDHNVRDMFLGFLVVALSYIVCGILGSIGFSNPSLFPDSAGQIGQVCVNMFPTKNGLATFIRACIFCQIFASNCLLFACERSQILLLVTGDGTAKSNKINVALNGAILLVPLLLAIFYPQAGKIAGLLGAVGGCLCIYILPTVTFLK